MRDLGVEAGRAGRSSGRPSAASRSSRTHTAATTSRRPSSRWTRTASSWRMRVHTIAAMGAYLSTFASCVPTILYATLLAGQYNTPRSTARSRRCSPTPRRWTPIAAPAGRRRLTWWSAWWRRAARDMNMDPAGDPAAQLHHRVPLPDAGRADLRHRQLPRDARPRDRSSPTSPASPRAQGRSCSSAASCAVWASPATSRRAASRRPTSRARWARARACSRPARCAFTRPAR